MQRHPSSSQGVTRLRSLLTALALVLGLVGVPAAVTVATAGPAAASTITYSSLGYPWANATYVDQYYDWGYSTCPNNDTNCMHFTGALNGVTYGEADPWNYYLRNCTSFVAWELTQQGVSASAVEGLGNGGDWYNNAPASEQSLTPAVGEAAVQPGTSSNPDGHVAYISAYDSSTGVITVEEYNYDGQGDGDTRTGTPSSLGFSKYVNFGVSGGGGSPSATNRPSVVQYGSEMDVFVNGGGNVYKDTWNGSSWSGFSSLGGGNLIGNPSALQFNEGSYHELDVYATGANDGPVYKDTWNGSSWSGFSSLGGGLVSSPTAIQYNSEMDVFARNAGNTLWKDTWNGSSWSGWNPLGNNMAGDPAAMEWQSWELDVYSRGTDCALYHDGWISPNWSGFVNMSGCITGDPYAIEYNPGGYQEMDVYARGTDGAIWKRTWISPNWSGWNSLGGNMASDPVALQFNEGSYHEMDVFAVGTDGNVYKDTWNGSSWSGFSSLG